MLMLQALHYRWCIVQYWNVKCQYEFPGPVQCRWQVFVGCSSYAVSSLIESYMYYSGDNTDPIGCEGFSISKGQIDFSLSQHFQNEYMQRWKQLCIVA